MQRFHLALTTHNLESTISDYSVRLGIAPEVVVQGEYALWRTDSLNVSVRVDLSSKAGSLRHLGFEDSLEPGIYNLSTHLQCHDHQPFGNPCNLRLTSP